MTLLVLDIRLPEEIQKAGPTWQDLLSIREQLLSFALSFVVIALLWLTHAQKFRQLQRFSGTLFWLNIIFLLAVAVVPFTASLLAASGNATATAIYAGAMGVASTMLGLMSVHVHVAGLEGEQPAPQKAHSGLFLHFLSAGVFIVSGVVSIWSPIIAQCLWLLLIPIALVPDRSAALQ